MSDEDRDREERRREERQREEEERQRRKSAENVITVEVDEASALAAGPFDKQVWQQEAMEVVYEAQQSLWASILRLSSPHNSAAEKTFLSNLLAVTTLSADDENTLGTIDGHILSSEMNYRFSDLTKDLRWLKSKVENYRLVREIVEKGDD